MSNNSIQRQHGLWDSPISALTMASGLEFSDLAWSDGGVLAWRETRSDLGVIMLQGSGGDAPRDLNSDYSVRARVGYGGGDFTLGHGYVYFAEAESGRFYRQPLQGGQASPLTPAFGNYGSPCLSPDGRWLCFVHTYEGQDSLGIVDAEGDQWPRKLVSGDDFYMQPAWHPAGDRLAWIAWDQPNMPWDGTHLRLGKLQFAEGGLPRVESVETIAGDKGTSIFQPLFAPHGRYLAYCSDATGWWQIFIYDLEDGQHRQLTHTTDSDHALPAWVQGMHTYGFSPDGESLLFIRNRKGFASLWKLHIESGVEEQLQLDEQFTWLEQISVAPDYNPGGGLSIALLASGSASPRKVITLDLPSQDTTPGEITRFAVRRRASAEDLSPELYSPAQPLTWVGADGEEVHGLFFPPHNAAFQGSAAPPLIVRVHGGPTSQVRANFNPRAQFFATRGYAFLEVNYRGSTGYGRPYWQALYGRWGQYDVEDAISGARYLADQGLIDGSRAVILGGSAGGFTVLQALVDHPGFFKAGVCLYGIANQFTLAADTHKFEARYGDKLLGPLPEAADLYRQRSPLFHADRIQDPVILFQGEDDRVVPRDQSDQIVASLEKRRVSHEYYLYPGEGHGFRKIETLKHHYNTVDRFLKQYVIFA
jgi:dipeptidyl aminopeptidase/acylaminoacyl peptidase